MNIKVEDKLADYLNDEESILLADGFDDAFLGIGRQFGKPFAIYDKERCLRILQETMSEEEAIEYFSFNVEGAWVGEKTPIFLEFL
jgi:hypothetical protein